MSGPGMPPGLPPELAAMMSAGAPGSPGMPEAMSAGGEAVAQSAVAKQGLEAWKQVQSLNGQRPEGDLVKALILYVLTEGQNAPMAAEMAEYLQSLGVQIPGIGADNPGGLEEGPAPKGKPVGMDEIEPEEG